MQPIQNRKDEWKEGIVSKKLKSRSYEVRTGDGKTYRRNRKFLRASVESRKEPIEIPSSAPLSMSDSSTVMSNEGNPASENIRSPLCNNSNANPVLNFEHSGVQTRSGRTVRAPDRLNL